MQLLVRLSESPPSRFISLAVVVILLLGFLTSAPAVASQAAPSSGAAPATRGGEPPSWLLSLLKEGSDSSSSPSRVAVPLDVTLGQKINGKDQNGGNLLYYSPYEIREAYNTTGLLGEGDNGTGITISIVDAFGDPYIQGELNNFSALFGIPSTTVHVVCVDGPCNYTEGITEGWNGEIALDVEWAHAMAPGATINLYIGSNAGQPLYDAVAAAVAGTNGNGTFLSPSSIISMSWGSPENDFGESGSVAPVFGENYPWLDQVFQQGVSQGITFFASSGDWGGYDQAFGQNSPYGAALYPSTDPFVTGVGGTSLYLNTTSGSLEYPAMNATGTYGYETAWSWNNEYDWGTGGGFSTFFSQPAWQNGPGVPTGATRGAPDVAWDADVLTGVAVYVNGGLYIYGGTSVGSPSWAGAMALIDQKAGRDLGLITPTLYSILNNGTEYAKAFHDVTVGDDDPLQAGPGWDPVTGIGSPNVGELAGYLAAPSTSLTVTSSSNVVLGTSAGYSSVTITAQAFSHALSITAGTGYANVTSSSGEFLGRVALSYNMTAGEWTGTFGIGPSDPPGMWVASVNITSGAQTGVSSTSFPVGDGVTLFAGWSSFLSGDQIPIAAVVTSPTGAAVATGSFDATFYLSAPSGPVEGRVPLAYNSSAEMWEGTFAVAPSMSQGPWVVVITGTDGSGNRAAPAYAWEQVGLTADTITSSPTLTGGPIPVYAEINFSDYAPTSGTFEATAWLNGVQVASTALSFNPTYELWTASLSIPTPTSAGFYRIVVTGNDGAGNTAYGETLVRVAPTQLRVAVSVSPSDQSLPPSTNETVVADVSYTNGTLVEVGSVSAFTPAGYGFPLTFNEEAGGFVGTLPPQGAPGPWAYQVAAFDSWGNSGAAEGSYNLTSTAVQCQASAVALGHSTQCTATVSGADVSGTVDWAQSGTGDVSFSPSDACTLAAGQCSVTVEGASLGSVFVNATYGGNAGNHPANGTSPLIVSDVGVACSPSAPAAGAAAACTATVAGSPTPTGRVTWSAEGSGRLSSARCSLSGGACTVRYLPTAPGQFELTATYDAGGHASPVSVTVSLSASEATSTTRVTCSSSSTTLGSRGVTCTAIVRGNSPSGIVFWSEVGTGELLLSSAECSVSHGHCSVSLYGVYAGVVYVTALYGGDANNNFSLGFSTITVKPARTSMSLRCVTTGTNAWQCTAKLNGFFGETAGPVSWAEVGGTGTVSFSSNSCNLSANLTCTVTVTGSSPGNVRIGATYVGDVNNLASDRTTTVRVR